jgi:hypothetical protein
VTFDPLVVISVAAGAVAQSVTGIGLILLCGPFLLASAGSTDGLRVAVIISLVFNVTVLCRGWRGVRLGNALRLLLPAVVVTVPLAFLIKTASPAAADAAAGAAIVVAAALLARGHRWPWLASRTGTVAAGAASGAMNAVSATAGPMAALYATNAGWPPRTLAVTLQAYFAGLNLVTLPALGLPRHLGVLPAAALGLALGLVVGQLVGPRVPPESARRLVLLVATVGGLSLLVAAFD